MRYRVQSGLKIRPYKNAFLNYDRDRELKRLARYLERIASMPDFTLLEHREWEVRGAQELTVEYKSP